MNNIEGFHLHVIKTVICLNIVKPFCGFCAHLQNKFTLLVETSNWFSCFSCSLRWSKLITSWTMYYLHPQAILFTWMKFFMHLYCLGDLKEDWPAVGFQEGIDQMICYFPNLASNVFIIGLFLGLRHLIFWHKKICINFPNHEKGNATRPIRWSSFFLMANHSLFMDAVCKTCPQLLLVEILDALKFLLFIFLQYLKLSLIHTECT